MIYEKLSVPMGETAQGDKLKSMVGMNLKTIALQYSLERSPYAPMANEMSDNFDIFSRFDIWRNQRGKAEIRNTIGSFCGALHYAYIKSDKEDTFLPLYQSPSSPELWRSLIEEVHDDPEMRQTFEENAWRQPVTLFPERGIPLQAILSQKFPGKRIKGIDLGAGLNTAFSFLNSRYYMDYYAKQGIDVRPVDITLGLGVDLQDRDPEWVRASVWPIEGLKEKERIKQVSELIDNAEELAKKRNNRDELVFPTLTEDITDPNIYEKIINKIPDHGEGKEVEVVVTNFLTQLLDENFVNDELLPLILRFLKEGGIWIMTGEDSPTSELGKLSTQDVNVFEKKDGKFTPPTVPFKLLNRITPVINTAA